jgi:hypothetical protein
MREGMERWLITPDEELASNTTYGKSDERAYRHFHTASDQTVRRGQVLIR